jgi:hypothetical protein
MRMGEDLSGHQKLHSSVINHRTSLRTYININCTPYVWCGQSCTALVSMHATWNPTTGVAFMRSAGEINVTMELGSYYSAYIAPLINA